MSRIFLEMLPGISWKSLEICSVKFETPCRQTPVDLIYCYSTFINQLGLLMVGCVVVGGDRAGVVVISLLQLGQFTLLILVVLFTGWKPTS